MFYLSFITPYSAVAGIYSERGCHVTYVNLNSDWRVTNSDSQSELSNGHHKATTDFTWAIVSLDSVESGKPLFHLPFPRMSDFTIIGRP